MTKLDLAYLAGVMDSDGFFSIRKQFPSRKCPLASTFTEICGAGQVSSQAVSMLHALFGGTVRLRTRKDGPNWKPIHYWVANNRDAAKCAKALLPYLRIKSRQAELLLLIRKSKDTPGIRKRGAIVGIRSRQLAPDTVAARQSAYEEVKALNGRGVT